MEPIEIRNPFPGACSFLIAKAESTQDEARRLAEKGYAPGSLVAAEEQGSGRGRFPGRAWESQAGKNLLFTIFLDPGTALLPGLPVRIGLALHAAVALYARRLGARYSAAPSIKWPNDLMIGRRKAAGILCEAGPKGVFAGIGLNCNQASFPPGLESKATSLALELGREVSRWSILELFLEFLIPSLSDPDWRRAAESRLWMRGEEASFSPGASARSPSPGPEDRIKGTILGLDEAGSLLIQASGEGKPRAYAAGELSFSAPAGSGTS
jgi:BirA family transcriptional regulator, biotin operon repressor / biotin---[acetyl-CoA-carboxylase] ligase